MPEVVALGEILLDVFSRPVGASLKAATSFIPSPGGATANAAVAFSRLGVDVGFIGGVGDDSFGKLLLNVLRDEGVDLTLAQTIPDLPTMVAFVATVRAEDQDFTMYRGADMKFKVGKQDRAYIASAKALLFNSITLSGKACNTTLKAVRWAREDGVLIAYDANFRPALWPDMEVARAGIMEGVKCADVCKVNEVELELVTGSKDPVEGSHRLLSFGPSLCLVTLGASGAYFSNGRFDGHIPAFLIEVLDTTGCGDAFCAGFITQYLEYGKTLEALSEAELFKMIRFANAVSACSATRIGAMTGLPRRDIIKDFLRRNPK